MTYKSPAWLYVDFNSCILYLLAVSRYVACISVSKPDKACISVRALIRPPSDLLIIQLKIIIQFCYLTPSGFVYCFP